MNLRFASLGSGSSGNATLVGTNSNLILIDCGFSKIEAERRLGELNVKANELDAIMVTHEHGDHAGGVYSLASRHSIPVFGTSGTLAGANLNRERLDVCEIHNYEPFHVGDLYVVPFPVPHDAREPSQLVVSVGKRKLGILTDCGAKTSHLLEMLNGCDALLIEFNHDSNKLKQSRYPASLKSRVASDYGHLDNDTALDILQSLNLDRLKPLMACHLSIENNSPTLVKELIKQSIDLANCSVTIADQDNVSGWIEI